MTKEKLAIIDGHALIHRAYHAIPPLTTKNGKSVNAVYGFTSILLNVIRDLKPKYIIVTFDLPGKTKRHEEYIEYKANRKTAPDDLKSQFKTVREVVRAFNIPAIDKPGYEADDVIGTIANNIPKNIEKFIVTGDLDELQLVNESTKVYTMKRGFSDTFVYDENEVKKRYQISPSQLVDYKALRGDPSDNIPGVKGIGEKTATELIKEFGSLDGVYKNINQIKTPVAKKLLEEKELAYLSQKLSKIETNLDIQIELDECLLANFNKESILKKFEELGFNSLISRLPKDDKKTESPQKRCQYKIVTKNEDLKKLAKSLAQKKVIAIDTETTSKDQIEAVLVGISISYEKNKGYYLPLRHNSGTQLSTKEALKELRPILESKKILKVGHNLKYDYVIFKKEGITLSGPYFDTMIASFLIDPNLRAQKLSSLALLELGVKMIEIESLIKADGKEIRFDKVPIDKAAEYATEDASIAFSLYKILSKKLSEKNLDSLAKKIEFPLISVLAEMELSGIKIDKKRLQKLSTEINKKITELEKKIFQLAEEKFNIASPKQLQAILFDKLKIHQKIENPKELKNLRSGGFSTAASELEKLKKENDIIKYIISYRELSKLLNTYIDVLPNSEKKDGRIHTSYNQTITQTGRLSSSDPNLQNIPVRTTVGKKIKASFVASPKHLLLSADYSQIELRVIAHLANEENMIKIFSENRDIHTETAIKLYSLPEQKITKEMRRVAKIVNFGIIYGVSAHGLRQQIGVSHEEGQDLIDRYFEINPKIKEYSQKMIIMAKEKGYVETIFGRRRYLPEINSKNYMVKAAAERMAINMPVQGTAADLIKIAMIKIAKELPQISPNSKMLLQVHDELVIEVEEKDIEKVSDFVKNEMNTVAKLLVPLKTDIRYGKNWGA